MKPKAKSSEYEQEHEPRQDGARKLTEYEKARVIAIIDAMSSMSKEQAILYGKLWKHKDNPEMMEKIYQEA